MSRKHSRVTYELTNYAPVFYAKVAGGEWDRTLRGFGRGTCSFELETTSFLPGWRDAGVWWGRALARSRRTRRP